MTHKALIRQLQISCLGLDRIDPLRLLVDDVIEALREHAMREVQRLGQEIEQKPVAKVVCNSAGQISMQTLDGNSFDISKYVGTKLYTTPPQRTWVGLTDEDVNGFVEQLCDDDHMTLRSMIRAIEAKLKQLNT